VLLKEHLLSQGHHRVAVLYDETPVGTSYDLWFQRTTSRTGDPEVAYRSSVSALAEDLRADVEAALAVEPDALLYLGLGISARAVALGVEAVGWKGPVVTNSALMFGYARPDWRSGFEDWVYIDTISDGNPVREALKEKSRMHTASPIGVAAYDIGRLLGEAIAQCEHLTRAGIADGLRRVKQLPATSGYEGTLIGFGVMEHAALKGHYLVLREWKDGRSAQVER
jgi:branched-chain amino acid transport system substrate-binding protein